MGGSWFPGSSWCALRPPCHTRSCGFWLFSRGSAVFGSTLQIVYEKIGFRFCFPELSLGTWILGQVSGWLRSPLETYFCPSPQIDLWTPVGRLCLVSPEHMGCMLAICSWCILIQTPFDQLQTRVHDTRSRMGSIFSFVCMLMAMYVRIRVNIIKISVCSILGMYRVPMSFWMKHSRGYWEFIANADREDSCMQYSRSGTSDLSAGYGIWCCELQVRVDSEVAHTGLAKSPDPPQDVIP